MRRHGLEPGKDINLIPGGDNTARLAAMDGGKIDAAFVSSPADIFGAKRGYKVLLWTRDHVPLMQNAMVTTDKQLKTAAGQSKAHDQSQHRSAALHSRAARRKPSTSPPSG